MTDTKRFTPGPWDTTPCSNGGLIVVRGAYGTHPQSHVQIVPEADATLIAAAPEMYEALAEMVNVFVDISRNEMNRERSHAISSAVHALRKAEGRG